MSTASDRHLQMSYGELGARQEELGLSDPSVVDELDQIQDAFVQIAISLGKDPEDLVDDDRYTPSDTPGAVGLRYRTESGVVGIVVGTLIVGDHHQWCVIRMLSGDFVGLDLIGELIDLHREYQIKIDTSIDMLITQVPFSEPITMDATAHQAFLEAEPPKTAESYAAYQAGAEPDPSLFDQWNGVIFRQIV